jgi:hypothetical protein
MGNNTDIKDLESPRLSDTEVHAILGRRLIHILGDALPLISKLESLVEQKEHNVKYGRKSHRNIESQISKVLEKLDAKFKVKSDALESEKYRVNAARKPELRFNWDDAAESAVPTEQIHISDAPPAPRNVREAMMGRYSKYFMRAMMVEMESIRNKEVYDVVDRLPAGRKAVNSKWVYDYKTDPMGFISKFKARLVAVGSGQVKNQDYTDTHSPVVKAKVLRVLLAMSAVLGIAIEQLDVETAFLYGTLTETNYMRLPQGFQAYNPDGSPKYAKLIKSLYGLHQAGREWYLVLKAFFLEEGFVQLKSDACTFLKVDPATGHLVIACIYVDDILIASADRKAIAKVKTALKARFNIKDLGDAKWMLKIQIENLPNAVWQGHITYITTLLKEFGFWDIPETEWEDTPMASTWTRDALKPLLAEGEATKFRTLIAKLIYLQTTTRPDLCYAVSTLAQYQKEPRQSDWKALERILRYLRFTVDLGNTFFKNQSNQPVVYTSDSLDIESACPIELPEGMTPKLAVDASFGQEDDRKSRTGYMVFAFGGLVSWFSKKQTTVALSSTEAELIALVEGTKEANWFREFFKELGFKINKPTKIDQDNQSVIAIAINPIQHSRIKHMEIKNHYVRENVENGTIELLYCPTELMIADILTKPLPSSQHWKLVNLMGMRRLSDLQAGRDSGVHLTTRKKTVRH